MHGMSLGMQALVRKVKELIARVEALENNNQQGDSSNE